MRLLFFEQLISSHGYVLRKRPIRVSDVIKGFTESSREKKGEGS